MTAGALCGARRIPRQSLGIAFGSSRNLGASPWQQDYMASPRGNGQRREIACLAVQCVSLPLFDSPQLSAKSENKASHTKSPLRHRRQPDALNDSGSVIRRSPNPAPKSRCCFWLFTESWGGKSMAAGLHGIAKRERAKKRNCAFYSAMCLSAAPCFLQLSMKSGKQSVSYPIPAKA